MGGESWVGLFALHAVERALLLRKQGALCPRDRHRIVSGRPFLVPFSVERLHGQDAAKIDFTKWNSARARSQEDVLAIQQAHVEALGHVLQQYASMGRYRGSTLRGWFVWMQLDVDDLDWRATDYARGKKDSVRIISMSM